MAKTAWSECMAQMQPMPNHLVGLIYEKLSDKLNIQVALNHNTLSHHKEAAQSSLALPLITLRCSDFHSPIDLAVD